MAQKPRERQVDCAIIGAGPVGILAAATRAPGQNTLVLEREDWVGGNWRSFQKDGALFESGLHFVHQPRQWNEYLFDLGFELPVTEPTGQALLWEKGSFRPLPSDALSPLEQLYVHPENVIVRGGMQSFLEKVVMAKDITVSHGEALISLETDDSGIALGKTTAGTLTADQWIWTGSPRVARRYLPPAAAKHTDFGDYQAAIVSQFILRRPVSDLSSVLVLRHRVDHIEYRFLGLFDSNVDPTRAPAGRQTTFRFASTMRDWKLLLR
jgi:protoporphyrinogen oxidase